MVYTVTFNPSLDYIVKMDRLAIGRVNRTRSEALYPGGKGINVSIVLKSLGVKSRMVGFIAGFTGEAIEKSLLNIGCSCDFIPLANGMSRINVKIRAEQESEINGQGPLISAEELDRLFEKLDALCEGDILVLAGSIPGTLPKDIYEKILSRLSGRNILAVVDAAGELLKNVLKYRPFLIKPNRHELEEIFGVRIGGTDEILSYAKKLQAMGAKNVLISLAGEGAVLLDEHGKAYHRTPPKGEAVNSVGAGDSMVAGFLAGYLDSGEYGKAFHLGLAAGSASAFSEWLPEREKITALLKEG